jgi:16S rRNA (guanine966-N2)-methyltransferase
MLKISTGFLRGIQLKSPKGNHTRPTSERVRQSLFNILLNAHWIKKEIFSLPVVDLFSGTGALGFEASSHSAEEITFVEKDPKAVAVLKQNIVWITEMFKKQNVSIPKFTLIQNDAAKAYSHLPEVGLLFCDPPYRQDWFLKIVDLERQFNRVITGGVFVFEEDSRVKLPQQDVFVLKEEKNYGDSTLYFFVKEKEYEEKSNLSGNL